MWTERDGISQRKEGRSIPDIVAVEGDDVFVVEATTLDIPPLTLLQASWTEIRRSLMTIWTKSSDGGSPGGKLEQLLDACEALAEGDITLNGIPISERSRFHPVLLTKNPLPQLGNITEQYRKWLVDAGLPSTFVLSLTFLSLEEFEYLVELKLSNESWARFFQKKHDDQFANDDMSHVISSNPLTRADHPRLSQWRDAAFETMQQFLFRDDPS